MFFPEGSTEIWSKRLKDVMRGICTLTFVGFISFTGFAVHAQPGGGLSDIDKLIQSISSGGASSGLSVGSVVQGVTEQVLGTSSQTEQQVPVLEGPLNVEEVVPEVNKTTIEVIDTQTGRYPPRLKINFAEFPLRSLTEANRPNNGRGGRNAQSGTPTEIVAQRIQTRLRVPKFQLAIEDRTATISGTVATDRERKQIELMLRFEPGISVVKNDITVVP